MSEAGVIYRMIDYFSLVTQDTIVRNTEKGNGKSIRYHLGPVKYGCLINNHN